MLRRGQDKESKAFSDQVREGNTNMSYQEQTTPISEACKAIEQAYIELSPKRKTVSVRELFEACKMSPAIFASAINSMIERYKVTLDNPRAMSRLPKDYDSAISEDTAEETSYAPLDDDPLSQLSRTISEIPFAEGFLFEIRGYRTLIIHSDRQAANRLKSLPDDAEKIYEMYKGRDFMVCIDLFLLIERKLKMKRYRMIKCLYYLHEQGRLELVVKTEAEQPYAYFKLPHDNNEYFRARILPKV
jgi:hypothetical protein